MNQDRPQARQERDPRDPREPRRKVAEAAGERTATHAAAATGGAVAGATAGAAGGFAFGPLGSAVGAAAGAVAGAVAGAATGPGNEAIDTRRFEAWWREHFAERPYVPAGARYEDYEPAYRYAIREYVMTDHPKAWPEVADHLGARWRLERGDSRMSWEDAMPAVRDAWLRMYEPQRYE
jgi:hypothetical protein